jgi:hypothetical protein
VEPRWFPTAAPRTAGRKPAIGFQDTRFRLPGSTTAFAGRVDDIVDGRLAIGIFRQVLTGMLDTPIGAISSHLLSIVRRSALYIVKRTKREHGFGTEVKNLYCEPHVRA